MVIHPRLRYFSALCINVALMVVCCALIEESRHSLTPFRQSELSFMYVSNLR